MMELADCSRLWRLGDLIAGLAETEIPLGAASERPVCALCRSAESLTPGALYLAPRGTRHGLADADLAVRRGATAILAEPSPDWPVEVMLSIAARLGLPVLALPGLSSRLGQLAHRFHGEPSACLDVLGIAGTTGKTSLAHCLAQALGHETRCALMGGLGWGFPGDLSPNTDSQSDILGLHETLARLNHRGARALVLPLASHWNLRWDSAAVAFRLALFTDLGAESAAPERRTTLDRATLARLFAAPTLDTAVVNLDDPYHSRLLTVLAPGVRVAAFSLDPASVPPARCAIWVRAVSREARPDGVTLRIESSAGGGWLRSPLLGVEHSRNLLAVLAVLLSRGHGLRRALDTLALVRGVPGRMESFGGDEAPLVIVDHGHTPDAIEKALTDLQRHRGGRVIAVVGCDGDRDRGERPRIGVIAERLSDALILTDDNPRGESGDAIIADLLADLAHPELVRVERRRGLAIRRAIALAGRGDKVLVAGKGHETTQDLGGLKVHFSDRAQVVEALREWREGHH